MDDIILYSHCGSQNHGCEALARCFTDMFKDHELSLYSFDKSSDEYYGMDKIVKIKNSGINKKDDFLQWFLYSVLNRLKIIGNKQKLYCNLYKCDSTSVALSVGGDNYCYPELLKELVYVNNRLRECGVRTVLAGCSIEPELLTLSNTELIKDLKGYDAIIARESITYNALISCGIEKNVFLCPDIAFMLRPEYDAFSEALEEKKYVGINISPMIMDYCKDSNLVMENYCQLIQYILDELNLDVLLIPHVVADNSNDIYTIKKLKEKFPTDRVISINDQGCEKIKGIISKCRFFVGARTHSTIAAYSMCVPTLVVGYSVKAKGIALDLFGEQEHYVVPVWELEKDTDLLKRFLWIKNNEESIRNILENKMKEYVESVQDYKIIVDSIINSK